MVGPQFRCPRCDRTWDTPDDLESHVTDLETLYERSGEIAIEDPPFDTLVALSKGSLLALIDEVRGKVPKSTVVVHCLFCSLKIQEDGDIPAHNPAVMAGKNLDSDQKTI